VSEELEHRGTGNASLATATEVVLILAAALAAIVIAGLALIVARVGAGSATATSFMRLNELLVGPFAVLLGHVRQVASPLWQQLIALLGYGLIFTAAIGVVSWLDRRQALY
jgi:hypothetical protein